MHHASREMYRTIPSSLFWTFSNFLCKAPAVCTWGPAAPHKLFPCEHPSPSDICLCGSAFVPLADIFYVLNGHAPGVPESLRAILVSNCNPHLTSPILNTSLWPGLG